MEEIKVSKMPQKADRRIQKTKKGIRQAMLTLMQKKDISSIRIKELAEEADINRKTFYDHYSRIEDVLSEMDDDLLSMVDAEINMVILAKISI